MDRMGWACQQVERVRRENINLQDDFRLDKSMIGELKRTRLGDVELLLEAADWLIARVELLESRIKDLADEL